MGLQRIKNWLVRFGTTFWSALGWRRTFLIAVLTYISTYWDRGVIFASNYLPSGLYLELFKTPAWAVATIVATVLLVIFLVLRMMPQVRLEFGENDVDCVHDLTLGGHTKAKIFRVRVTNLAASAQIFSGFLTRAEKDNANAGLTGPLPLTFAPAEDAKGALNKTILPDVPAHLDIAIITEHGQLIPGTEFNSQLRNRIVPTSMQTLFATHGDYELEIVVASTGLASEKIRLMLHLTGSWKTTKIVPVRRRVLSFLATRKVPNIA